MAFEYVGNLAGGNPPVAPPKDVETYQERNASALLRGAVCEFHTDGNIMVATAQSRAPALITIEPIPQAGRGRCMWVLPGMVFKVPVRRADGTKFTAVPGTATNGIAATTVRGQQVRLANGGASVDGASGHNVANPLVILRIERSADAFAADTVAWVTFAQGLLFKSSIA